MSRWFLVGLSVSRTVIPAISGPQRQDSKPMRRPKMFAGIFVISALALSAATPPSAKTKPAWEWTIEERLAARSDENQRRLRVEAASAEREPAGGGVHALARPTVERGPADVIRGSRNPELLLSFEILGVFTRAAYGADDVIARDFRAHAQRRASELGLPSDFLQALESAAHDFIALQRREFALREQLATGKGNDELLTELRQVELAECRPRAAAIRTLRSKYTLLFDRFLYTVLAPGVSQEFDRPQDPAELRRKEAGCP